ncbi:RHS repeat domain-containing protein [Pseudomonas putida]|nr:RHS repeat-associated core domain-containing protein [Pseudomonas putida]
MSISSLIGTQNFDGLGRQLSVVIGGRTTLSHYSTKQLPPRANTFADGSRITFGYLAALDNVVEQIQPHGEPANNFTYDPLLAQISSATGALGTQRMTYTASGKPSTNRWAVDGSEHVTTWRHSLSGRLLGFEDPSQINHTRQHDAFGRLIQVVVGDVTCNITYDEFSRPRNYTTIDAVSGNQLLQKLGYDSFGRERTRTFRATLAGTVRQQTQTLTYNDLDQVVARHWQDDERKGSERFDYDLLGRLSHYSADPAVAPEDPFGNRVVEQRFTLTPLDGYAKVVTSYVDGSRDEAEYHYDNAQDPCQVSAISHTHRSWPARIELRYDARGRLQSDSLGRRLSWDAQDRVTRVEYRGQVCEYAYDPSGNLADRRVDGVLSRSFHSAGQLTHERRDDELTHLAADAGQLFAVTRLRAGVRQGLTTLLGCDAQGSVRVEADNSLRSRRYTAHGAEPGQASPADNPFGYTGERREPLSGWYIPAGYRPYDPLLMIFLAPDSESPFGRGGLNAYAYCGGDPVNRIDPDGHAWWNWLVAGIGLVLGAVATVASFGAAAPAVAALSAGGLAALTASGAASIAAATLGTVSLGTGIASTVIEAAGKDSRAGEILGWVSLGTGLAGSALEIAPKAASAAAKLGRSIGRAKTSPGLKAPIQTVGQSDIFLINPKTNKVDVAFHRNLLNSSEAAFETHGSNIGWLDDTFGKHRSAGAVARRDIAPRLNQLPDYVADPNKPLVLLSCHGANTCAAQNVANALKRPVKAFEGALLIPPPSDLNQPIRLSNSFGPSNGLYQKSTLPHVIPFQAPDSNIGFAVPRIFYPR